MGTINRIKDKIKDSFKFDATFWEYEVQANKIVAIITSICLVALIIIGLLDNYKVVDFNNEISLFYFSLESILWLLIPIILCIFFKGEKRWLKVVMMFGLIVVAARLYSIMGYQLLLFMVIPTVLSCVYYSKRLTAIVTFVTALAFAGATYLNVYYGHVDMNTIDRDKSFNIRGTMSEFVHNNYEQRELYRNTFIYNYVPNLLMFIVIAIISIWISNRCHHMVIEKITEAQNATRIQSELNLATDIQTDMLPSTFPPFPDREEFDIYAIMNPAKEVGGDFYDFFMIDDNKLAVVIGDVSGKGVPAALFMVVAKTLIKNFTMVNPSPGTVFSEVNDALCENNEAGLFVTAWMGVIDLVTGEIKYVDAGHNPPLIKHGGSKYHYLANDKSFVLAGMDGIIYKEHTIQLDEGDELILYTDGVTEAYNGRELYGDKRLEDLVNSHQVESCCDGISVVKNDIDSFSEGMEQADDITMLWVKYKKKANENG